MTQKPETSSGVLLGTMFIVITFKPRVRLDVPKERSCPIPVKYIDVSGGKVRHWMCCWKVALATLGLLRVARNYRGHWTGFTQFTALSEESPNGDTWSGRR